MSRLRDPSQIVVLLCIVAASVPTLATDLGAQWSKEFGLSRWNARAQAFLSGRRAFALAFAESDVVHNFHYNAFYSGGFWEDCGYYWFGGS